MRISRSPIGREAYRTALVASSLASSSVTSAQPDRPHSARVARVCSRAQGTADGRQPSARRSVNGQAEEPTALPSAGPDPFSLADPPTVQQILEAAGFADVAFTDVHEPVYYGPDVAAALDWARSFACTNNVLKQLDPAAPVRAAGRLREVLAARLSNDGVWFDSRAWIVAARHR